MNTLIHKPRRLSRALLLAGLCGLGSLSAQAYELYKQDDTVLNADFESMVGIMRSQKSYALIGNDKEGSVGWSEGYAKYGVSGSLGLGSASSLYGKVNLLSSATWGDGDAANVSSGNERRTKWEDAYVGWRSGNLFSALGQDGVDISLGRQMVVVGDGFLINGDAINAGDGQLGKEYNRGGAYYLAARKAFGKTAVLRLGGKEGWRGDLMWLKSDSRVQANTEISVVNIEHNAAPGNLGLTWIHGIDVDTKYDVIDRSERKGMDIVSLRGSSSLGVDNLNLSFEYASEDLKHSRENGWYAAGSWTFAETPWKPVVTYRYSRFSELFDPLFYGFNNFGTWFQGEVAANYAGPLSSNTTVHHLGLTASPREDLALGLLYFDFRTLKKSLGDLSGRELNLYAWWTANENWQVGLLGGLYKPRRDALEGGTQLGGTGRNSYAQFIVMTTF
jgi:hypothetical protein